eukprot:COSAG05_NODE_628_length_8241_cov_5.614468_3_plen_46_part_00
MRVDGSVKRLEKRYSGCILGEMAFFLGKKRHCSLLADEDDTEIIE